MKLIKCALKNLATENKHTSTFKVAHKSFQQIFCRYCFDKTMLQLLIGRDRKMMSN